jgi:hypothetical protein
MADLSFHGRSDKARRHLEEMRLALAEGLSLDQARQRLDTYSEHASRLGADTIGAAARVEWPIARRRPTPAEAPIGADAEERQPRLWWDDR